VRDLRGCAFQADDVLADRMKTEDAVGGEAAFERRESGAMTDGSARDHMGSADDRWRAVGMSGMTRDRDQEARQKGLIDGSPLVRRAALRAIMRHGDPGDFDAVYTAARLDPDGLVRSSALRALPALAGERADVANKLRDLWTSGDDGLREDIAAAYASRAVYAHGGREALFHVLTTDKGAAVIEAAAVVLHSPVGDDPELHPIAESRLIDAIKSGTHRARLHAIAVAPLSAHAVDGKDPVELAVGEAAHDEDLDVRIAALGRLVDPRAGLTPKDRDDAVRALENLAYPGVSATPLRESRARWLLALAGDLRVQAWLETDLHARHPDLRVTAAEALAALGRASRAAVLLADEDPGVRVRGACVLLRAEAR
jgi:hypothetical protein